jgi:hypothetical protein
MFLSNPAKIFCTALCFSLLFAGCSLWRKAEDQVAATPPPVSELPFTTREPDVFQTEVVVRMGETERRMFVARSGEKRRVEYDIGTDSHRAVLITEKEYLLYFKRRVFVESSAKGSEESGSSPTLSHLLHARDYTEFEEAGRDGSVVQFRARINESTAAEVLIFFDESIGLPIRHEFYSVEGDKRVLQYSVELRGFRLEADDGLFEVPANFRRGSRAQ